MEYRKFGKLDWQASVLGFGAMRLPIIDNDPVKINETEAKKMIRYAIDHGINYVDTAYPYHGGNSEIVVGKALKDGYRQRVKLATKMPTWFIQASGDFDRYLAEQQSRLQADFIDFYLLHGLARKSWAKLRDLSVLRWAERMIADGRIGHLGFSFHDEFDAFKEIVDAYDRWTLCQIQYNYMDVDYQAGIRGLRYAAGKGLAVVVMEPLRGGRLTRKTPDPVARLWSASPQQRSPAEWALQWVWNHPEVSVALSGMSSMEQVEENIATAGKSGAGTLTLPELALVDSVREAYKSLIPIPCTGCGYCMPCPSGVEIPFILDLYNDAEIYGNSDSSRFRYCSPLVGLRPEQRADRCTECGQCQDACPQKIPVPEWLKKAEAMLNPQK